MRAHRTLVLVLSAILTLIVAAPTAPAGAAGKRLIIGGSTSVLPLMQKLATAYHKANPNIPAPQVSGGQSDIGISGAANGSLDIGDSSRDPIVGVDPNGLVFTKIARDGVCVITNKSNPVSNLSQQEVEGIFTGKIRDWSEVPGATASGPIDLFDRDGASGTAGRLPAHLPRRRPEDLAKRRGRVLQRPRAERTSTSDEHGDRLRLLRLHRRRQPGRLPGRRLQPAQRQVRPVRRRA